jgi:two-component system, cell cycle sensor histidine kinase and response regulator CckA
VHTDLDPALPTVEGDTGSLRQVLMNLIANAVDAIGNKVGSITLRTHACEPAAETLSAASPEAPLPAGRYACIEITDTGCGMNAETLTRIFEPFFTTKFGGHGLGLASVQGTLRSHGGGLIVQSQPGAGSRFHLYLPASDKPVPPPELPERDGPYSAGGTALVVDDEPTVRRLAGRMLEKLGFETLRAPDAQTALELLRERQGDVRCALLDLSMPGMSGTELAEAIHAEFPHVKIVLTSGYSERDVGSLRLGGEEVAFLQKPFAHAALRRTVQHLLADPPAQT